MEIGDFTMDHDMSSIVSQVCHDTSPLGPKPETSRYLQGFESISFRDKAKRWQIQDALGFV